MNIMHLLRQIESLLVTHEDKKQKALKQNDNQAVSAPVKMSGRAPSRKPATAN
jgi:hypothetical protein